MWEHRCNELHKNDLSNKVQKLNKIDISIHSLLKIDTISMLPQQRRIINITKTEIFASTPKFRREWKIKTTIIHQNHRKRMDNPATHRAERLVMQRWLQAIPCPPRVIHNNSTTVPHIRQKQQHTIEHWFWLTYAITFANLLPCNYAF